MKIKCYLEVFSTFGIDLIKLATFASIHSLTCVSMSEQKLLLVKRGLCPKLPYYGTCK